MANICIVANSKKEKAVQSAEQLKEWLAGEGHNVQLKILEDIQSSDRQVSKSDEPADLAVSMGGDGAILHTVEAFSDAAVPVLGVNYGQLGYLAEVLPEEVKEAVSNFFAGKHEIQERMRLKAVCENETRGHALNEIVLGKIQSAHTVRLSVCLGSEPFLTYEADGLIISTPTGSTAYSLSAGGPIVEPELETIILTPVAPHMIFDRSLVVAPDTELNIEIQGDYPVELSMDGFAHGELKPGESVCITRASQPARLVTFKNKATDKNFHKILKTKFGVKDR